MASDFMDMGRRDAMARQTREEGVPQVVAPQRRTFGERRDLIPDIVPAHGVRQVAAVEGTDVFEREDVSVAGAASGFRPWREFFDDRHLSRFAAHSRPLYEASGTVGGERAADDQQPAVLIDVFPVEAEECAEPEAREGKACQRTLTEEMEARKRQHPAHLEIVESPRSPLGLACLAPAAEQRPTRVGDE